MEQNRIGRSVKETPEENKFLWQENNLDAVQDPNMLTSLCLLFCNVNLVSRPRNTPLGSRWLGQHVRFLDLCCFVLFLLGDFSLLCPCCF